MKFKEVVQSLTDEGTDSVDATLFVTSLMPYQKADQQMLDQYNIKMDLEEVNKMLVAYHEGL